MEALGNAFEAVLNSMRQVEDNTAVYHGRQSLESLKRQNVQLSKASLPGGSLNAFDRYARKYLVDYCVREVESSHPRRYYLFFKARDQQAMEAALEEYILESRQQERPSILERLGLQQSREAIPRKREKIRYRERGMDR